MTPGSDIGERYESWENISGNLTVSQGTLIGIDQLILGATTSCDLLDFEGAVAIPTGTLITEELLTRIKLNGIIGLIAGRSVFVTHHLTPRRPTLDAISSRIAEMHRRSGITGSVSSTTQNFARELLASTFSKIANRKIPDINALNELAGRIIHDIELMTTAPVPAPRENLTSFTETMIDQAVDMAAQIAWHLKFAGKDQLTVHAGALGGLLHDVGMVLLPSDILESSFPLSDFERLEIKRHPYLGLRALSPLKNSIPQIASDILLFHHERDDGNGYPLRRSGKAVPEIARLAHILDAYIALVSPRPHRDPVTPHKAVEILLRDSGHDFHPDTLKEAIGRIGRYPVGSTVILSSNEVGVVVGNGKSGLINPIVDIYFSCQLQFSQTPNRVDLSRDKQRYIRQVMK